MAQSDVSNNQASNSSIVIWSGNAPWGENQETGRSREIDLRRPFLLLSDLDPEHAATAYLRDRDFDIEVLSQEWGVGWCPESANDYHARDRILIPYYVSPSRFSVSKQPRLREWFARYIGDPAGRCESHQLNPGNATVSSTK